MVLQGFRAGKMEIRVELEKENARFLQQQQAGRVLAAGFGVQARAGGPGINGGWE